MKFRLLLCCALLACGGASARPLVIENSQQLPFLAGWVAHAGNELIAMEWRIEPACLPDAQYAVSAKLYNRSSGQWVFARTLATDCWAEYLAQTHASMNASVAAIAMPRGLHIFERAAAGWVESVIDLPTRPHGALVDLQDDMILATEDNCPARALELRRNASGQWGVTATLPGPPGDCITVLDLDIDRAIVRGQVHLNFDAPPHVRIFERSASGWIAAANVQSHGETFPEFFGQVVAIRGSLALISGRDQGAHVYRRSSSGWSETEHFQNPDSGASDPDGSIQITGEYILRVSTSINRDSAAVLLYRERADQTFEHLVNLVGGQNNGPSMAFLAGNRVISMTGDFGTQPVEFELPSSFPVPTLVQDDFESGGAAQWSPLPGSQFSIVSSGTTHVYRQTSLAGDTGAIHSADMTNQSIGADVRPTAFNGKDRWVGLVTRYTDPANHYYVTLRDSNRIVLKRMLNGAFVELVSAPIDVVAGQTFNLRLDSSGSHHGVYVDGQKIIWTYDSTLSHGHAGIRMYKAAADIDNVVISPGPTSEQVYADRETTGGTWSGSPTDLVQSSVSTGGARRTSGWPREDQVVQATITVNRFSTVGSPWVGLITRLVDANNYYYVTARKSNELSLRRLTNGSITVLGSVPLTVTPGAPFVLRMEAIGDRLRVYINDVLRMEQAGAQVIAGKVGVMTYRAGARFDDYTAYEP